MPSKRKRNVGPVVTRKVGAAKKAASPDEGGSPSSPAAAPAGATQPLEPTEAGEGAFPATPSQGDSSQRPAAMTAPLTAEAAGEEAVAAEEATEPEGNSPAASEDDATPDQEPEEDALPVMAAPAAEQDDARAKTTKRKSTRKDRRRDRKKARADKRAQMSPARRVLRVVRTLLIALAVLAVVTAGAVAAGISYHRWYAYDDALEIQGTWYVSGTDTPIEVTADTIVLTDDVAYHYKLDPSSKTITFSFGNLRGQGHYRFSLDRQYLVIFDGTYSWEQSLSTDVSWLIRACMDYLLENPNDLAQGAFYNVTLLSRSSAEDSALSASVVATPEGPRVVWSAADAGNDAAGEGGTTLGNDTGSTGGGADAAAPDAGSDVDSLLGNLSDRPAS